MIVALSFVVIVSPLLYAVLLTSRLSINAKLVLGSAAFLILIALPIIAVTFKVNFGLS